MTALTRDAPALLALGLALSLLTGCDGEARPPASDASPTPTAIATAGRVPHFTGDLGVVLRTGRIVYGGQECSPGDDAGDDDRVCDPEGTRQYLVQGDPVRVRLVEARMAPADGHSSWTARFTFAPASRGRLVAAREAARSSGALVLVLADGAGVLLAAPVTRIEGRSIAFPDLTKPEAWDLVERVATG